MTDKILTPMHDESGKLVGYKERTVKQILIDAKAVIDTREKWHKGDWANENRTCFCSMGAIAEANGLDFDLLNTVKGIDTFCDQVFSSPAIAALCRAIEPGYKGPAVNNVIATFNDSADTSHAKVMEVFDRAIANA